MSLPLVSVLMPVFNGEKYLHKAVDSILKQTFEDFELIIINDGSTDSSLSILQNFQKRDPRIKLINRHNCGLIYTLNEGIALAKGDYIARMDGDDIALPHRFEKQVIFLDNNPYCVAVGSRVLLIDPDDQPIRLFSEKTTHSEIDAEHMEGKGGAICHPSVMMRRDSLKLVDGYREEFKHAEDLDLFLRLAEIGQLANCPDILLMYRMHYKSIGHSYRPEQKRAAMLAVEKACYRRKLEYLLDQETNDDQCPDSLDKIHRRWAWWALQAGNIKTAQKHGFLALRNNPFFLENWKVLICAFRGY